MDVLVQWGRDLEMTSRDLLNAYHERLDMLNRDPRTQKVPLLVWSVRGTQNLQQRGPKVRWPELVCDKRDGLPALLKTIACMFPHLEGIGAVFLAHGHDHAVRDGVASYLRKLGFRVIILQDLPGKGMTIIEKLESTEMAFGVVLLTPDDPGDGARENVIFELGFLMGKLGRRKVCALRARGASIPSNYSGVQYIPFDEGGAWKTKLRNELISAGLRPFSSGSRFAAESRPVPDLAK